jgi:poly-gamma-glutamate synthesis protein (capsule biosynthesis protein)
MRSLRHRFSLILFGCGGSVLGFVSATGGEPQPVTVVFGGDVMLDRGPGHAVVQGQDPFAELAAFLRGADISVCNLECVVAEGGRRRYKPYTFLARPTCVPLLQRYFTGVSVANNHSLDYGRSAFLRELELLQQAGLGHFGGGRNQREARQPLILERHGRRVALLGYNDMIPRSFAAGERKAGIAWLIESDVVADVQHARRRERADIVIPYLHWGEELEADPTPDQRALARRLIDAGADAVVGSNPHTTQTVDYYHGRPIIYSLGNFVFDYDPGDPAVWTGWLIRLNFGKAGCVDLETLAFEIDPAGLPHPIRAGGAVK